MWARLHALGHVQDHFSRALKIQSLLVHFSETCATTLQGFYNAESSNKWIQSCSKKVEPDSNFAAAQHVVICQGQSNILKILKINWCHALNCWNDRIPHQKFASHIHWNTVCGHLLSASVIWRSGHKHVMWTWYDVVCSNVKMAQLGWKLTLRGFLHYIAGCVCADDFFIPMNIFSLHPAAASSSHTQMCYRKGKYNILEVKFK